MKIRTSGISKLWLDKVLNFRGGWKTAARQLTVVDFTIRPGLPQGGSLASATYRLAVRYIPEDDDSEGEGYGNDDTVELDWFVKFPPTGREHRALMTAMGMFEHEHAAYEQLLPAMFDNIDVVDAPTDCQPDVPDCIYSSCDEYDVSIVMEDLTLRGFRAASRFDGLTYDETCMALKSLARFHANSIEVARQLGTDSMRAEALPALEKSPFSSEVLQKALESKGIFFRMAAALRDLDGQEENFQRLERYILKTPCLMKRAERLMKEQDFFRGYVSGDCWSNNFLFRYEQNPEGRQVPVEVKLLDFQMCHYNIPQADLHYFLNSGTISREVRHVFDSLLRDVYYEELMRVLDVLESDYMDRQKWSFERFFQVYRATAEYGLVMSMIALPLTFAPKGEGVPDEEKGDLSLDAIGDMTMEVLKGEAGGVIRERFAEVVQSMVDLGVL